jgi:proteasome lid subunit RPN8/RPN11
MFRTVAIQSGVLSAMLECARRGPQTECCGLLAGRDGIITRAFPAENVAADPARNYEIAPKELFHLTREIRASRLELLGIYHSHPRGANEPSPRDIERAYYPETAYFIISPRTEVPQAIRAFSIKDGRVSELEIQIVQI